MLVFLDADTTPEPGYVEQVTRLPRLLPDAVVVGRRRHADLTGCPVDAPVEVVGPEHELVEPVWLREAYVSSADLLHADALSFRFVISAVVACSRWWFEETGGFDESFDAYGGEDWEWAHRSWTGGGLVAHEPAAVAWHDGPDAGEAPRDHSGSGADPATRETLAVAARVGVPGVAARGLLLGARDVVVTLASGLTGREAAVTLDGLLRDLPSARVLVAAPLAVVLGADPRVEAVDEGSEPDLAAYRLHLHVHRGVLAAEGAWARLLAGASSGRVEVEHQARGLVTVTGLREARRAARWGRPDLVESRSEVADGLVGLPEDASLAAWLGGWAHAGS